MPQKLFLRKVSDIEREPDVGLRECETEKFLNELWEERMPESIWQQGIGFARTVPEAGNGKERETGAVTGGGNGVSIAAVPENTERRTEREGETRETIEALFRKRGFQITGSTRRSGSQSNSAAGLPDAAGCDTAGLPDGKRVQEAPEILPYAAFLQFGRGEKILLYRSGRGQGVCDTFCGRSAEVRRPDSAGPDQRLRGMSGEDNLRRYCGYSPCDFFF